MVVLFLNCGMRLSELVGLNVRDIDFSEKTMLIHGKGNKDRLIYINDACVETLQDYLSSREQPENEPNAIFLSNHKKRISTRRVQQIVDGIFKSAGLDGMGFSVHKLRHTSATLMYQYGETDTLVLKEVLGHSNIATTEIYTHVSNQQVRDAVEDNPLADYTKRKK
jgi:site-specific recombinase XerD